MNTSCELKRPLSPSEISKALETLVDWAYLDSKLTRKFHFKSFKESIEFVTKVSEVAEQSNHHPDIFIHFKEVTLFLWTHKTGGVTEDDLKLATHLNLISA